MDAALWDESSAIKFEGEGESRCEDENEIDLESGFRGLLLLSAAHLSRCIRLKSWPRVAITSVFDSSVSIFDFFSCRRKVYGISLQNDRVRHDRLWLYSLLTSSSTRFGDSQGAVTADCNFRLTKAHQPAQDSTAMMGVPEKTTLCSSLQRKEERALEVMGFPEVG